MNFELPPLGPLGPTSPGGPQRARGPRVPFERPDVRSGPVPSAPPVEVLREVERAARRYDELQAQGREVHVGLSPHGGLEVQLRDGAGNVLRSVGGSELLDIADGAAVD